VARIAASPTSAADQSPRTSGWSAEAPASRNDAEIRISSQTLRPQARHNTIVAAASPELRKQWLRNDKYPEDTVGRMIESAGAIFYPDTTVGEAIEQLRELVKATFSG